MTNPLYALTKPLSAKRVVGWFGLLIPVAIVLAILLATAFPEAVARFGDAWGNAL